MKRLSLFLVLCILSIVSSNALSYYPSKGQRGHRDDFAAVMPFIWTSELDEWGKSVTDNLDRFTNNAVPEYGGLSTHLYWKQEFGLKCSLGDHRYFFHWGYQCNPWSDDLLSFLPDKVTLNPMRLSAFKNAVRKEQQRRNRITNAETERILGFGSTGRQASYANAFIAILYDVHLLGDYESVNIEGLAPVHVIVAELSNSIRTIDSSRASDLISQLRKLANGLGNEREKAALVLMYLKDNLPKFIYEADDGRVNMRKHFEKRGFQFKTFDQRYSPSSTAISHKVTTDTGSQETVMVTKSGKYHKKGCHNLNNAKNTREMSIETAEKKGAVAAKCCFK